MFPLRILITPNGQRGCCRFISLAVGAKRERKMTRMGGVGCKAWCGPELQTDGAACDGHGMRLTLVLGSDTSDSFAPDNRDAFTASFSSLSHSIPGRAL
ncbi:hypothetical protein CCMA1212_010582 [Trichoderma ghanense]|uniref:Uncharacterized protein n=1 Tax=Trichoderma ghanense TaxID=65468 RepID=A0ABY2GQ55_9HYPO